MSGVAHHITKIQQKGFSQIREPLFGDSVLEGKQGVAGKAQGGIVEADGLEVLPGLLFLFFCEQVGHPGHQQKDIGLLDYLIPLQAVKRDAVIAGARIRLDGTDVHIFQQVERFILCNLSRNEPFHSVVMNNFQAGYQATKELYENGHHRIAHLACKREFSNSYFRRNGYETALQERGLESETDVWDVDISIEGAYQSVKAMLESGRRLPTAFFACNDTIAVGAVRAIQEKGFRVPEDVSIIGMDDTDICLACNPQLTTFHVHRREIGRIAVRQLLTPPAAEKGVYVKTEVSVSLVRRGSVRKIDGMIL